MNRLPSYWNKIWRKVSHFLNRRREDINDNISDFRKTRWMSEILKAAIISVVTIVCLYIIRILLSRNYEGIKLQEYLEKSILKYIDTANIKSQILYNGTYNILSEDNVIFVYSKYTTPESNNRGDEYYEKYGEYYDGVCLSIFERKKRNIIHEILGTEPAYNLVFCSNIEGSSVQLQYSDFRYSDLDNDGLTEFCLYTNTYFATTVSKELMLFSRSNGQWSLLTPDIEKLVTSISKASCCNVVIGRGLRVESENYNDAEEKILYIDVAVFELNDLLNKSYYYILGITDYGDMTYIRNPFNSSFEICYMFSCEYFYLQKHNDLRDKDYIYIMQQFSNKELFTDPNWNMGKPIISDEIIDLTEDGNIYWGYQTENSVYFGIPDMKK